MENMNILQVNASDLVGHIFNGFDLNKQLNKNGDRAYQIVLDKRSNSEYVYQIHKDTILHQQMRMFEMNHSFRNLLFPYAEEIEKHAWFKNADIVHYHMIHWGVLSLLDFPRLVNEKRSVWTIHDPWVVTGCCIHPLQCSKWKTGCGNCDNYQDDDFGMTVDNTQFMWSLKQKLLHQIDPTIIVSTEFMKRYIQSSPITRHFSRVEMIPFGVNAYRYDIQRKNTSKRELGLDENKIIVGCRTDRLKVKGCQYLYEALQNIKSGEKIQLVCVGTEKVPREVKELYSVVELGWVNDEDRMIRFLEACDVFVMPSEAESFGMMAVEAMAAGCAVMCFENTVIAEITEAPHCGITAGYLSSKDLGIRIEKLIHHPSEIRKRGNIGREIVEEKYRFSDYVMKHKRLYESMMM